jgi:hypothetical protein
VKPEVEEVGRIAGLPDPVIRNLLITECYSRLAAAVAAGRPGASRCTFATWASRQAGRTIRGEDLLGALRRELGRDAELLHPIASLWRALLPRGLFNRLSPLGRAVWSLHTPFDAFELASDAVWRAATARCSPRSGCTSRRVCSPRSARRSTRRPRPPGRGSGASSAGRCSAS